MKENPKNASGARKLLAHLLLDRSRLDEAQPLIDEAVKANANDPEVQALQASLLYRRGRIADALPLMQLAVKNAPENTGAHHQLALIFMARQDITNAEQQWREALSLSPGFMPALEALAGLAMSRGDAAQLNQLAEAAISTHPMDPSGYMWRATASYNRKKFTKAEADLMRAVQVAPDSASARNKLAGLRVAQRRFPEADQMFESVLSSEPRNAEALRGLVASYAAQKMPWARLVARVNAQITKQPDCGDFYVIRAALQADLKDTVGAEASVLKALQLNASDENAAILYARLAIQSGTVEKGIAVWENRINHHPDDVRAYVLLGTLEEARQRPQRAQQRYEAALRLKPDQPMAANNLAYLMLSTGQNVDTALSLAQIARQGLPDSPNAADTLAWAYYKKGVYRLATDLLEQAIKISPENATYHYHAGLAYQKLADHSKARAHLQRALKLAPNAPAAGKIRKALSDFERG
jgi:tetratricopeptide (TPR) repeat protein